MIWELLLDFLNQIKNNKSCRNPAYSRNIRYGKLPDEKQTILPADFVIVEGINVFLKIRQNDSLYMTDFFDFSIYGVPRSQTISNLGISIASKTSWISLYDPNNYYYRFTEQPLEEF